MYDYELPLGLLEHRFESVRAIEAKVIIAIAQVNLHGNVVHDIIA